MNMKLNILDPVGDFYEFALSLDGTTSNLGPWSRSRVYERLPDGRSFEPGNVYVYCYRDVENPSVVLSGYVRYDATGNGTSGLDDVLGVDNISPRKMQTGGYRQVAPIVATAADLATLRLGAWLDRFTGGETTVKELGGITLAQLRTALDASRQPLKLNANRLPTLELMVGRTDSYTLPADAVTDEGTPAQPIFYDPVTLMAGADFSGGNRQFTVTPTEAGQFISTLRARTTDGRFLDFALRATVASRPTTDAITGLYYRAGADFFSSYAVARLSPGNYVVDILTGNSYVSTLNPMRTWEEVVETGVRSTHAELRSPGRNNMPPNGTYTQRIEIRNPAGETVVFSEKTGIVLTGQSGGGGQQGNPPPEVYRPFLPTSAARETTFEIELMNHFRGVNAAGAEDIARFEATFYDQAAQQWYVWGTLSNTGPVYLAAGQKATSKLIIKAGQGVPPRDYYDINVRCFDTDGNMTTGGPFRHSVGVAPSAQARLLRADLDRTATGQPQYRVSAEVENNNAGVGYAPSKLRWQNNYSGSWSEEFPATAMPGVSGDFYRFQLWAGFNIAASQFGRTFQIKVWSVDFPADVQTLTVTLMSRPTADVREPLWQRGNAPAGGQVIGAGRGTYNGAQVNYITVDIP